jgi:hypothetical protein
MPIPNGRQDLKISKVVVNTLNKQLWVAEKNNRTSWLKGWYTTFPYSDDPGLKSRSGDRLFLAKVFCDYHFLRENTWKIVYLKLRRNGFLLHPFQFIIRHSHSAIHHNINTVTWVRKFLTLPGLELRTLGRPARSQSLYRLRYPSF